MTLPQQLQGRLRLPVIAAPMFLGSGLDLVIGACRAGVLGTFPALNLRTTEDFGDWLTRIDAALAEPDASGRAPAPYGVNFIVHRTNKRIEADLEQIVAHEVPLVITSLGAAKEVVDAVHSYGGLVFHDVVNATFAAKAVDIRGELNERMKALDAESFEGVLRPAFQQDEWKLILAGAVLGLGAGVAQLVWLFGEQLASM